jgi:hypothetical protein
VIAIEQRAMQAIPTIEALCSIRREISKNSTISKALI